MIKTKDVSSNTVEEAIEESSHTIETRGESLMNGSTGLSERYMAHGSEIVNNGGTFPFMKLLSLEKHKGRYIIQAQEVSTGRDFTLYCRNNVLKQYEGDSIDLSQPNALKDYIGQVVTIDVLRNCVSYEAVLIGKPDHVLSDGRQSAGLDLRIEGLV